MDTLDCLVTTEHSSELTSYLTSLSIDDLVTVLSNESDWMYALVLDRIEREQSHRLLDRIPSDRARRVVRMRKNAAMESSGITHRDGPVATSRGSIHLDSGVDGTLLQYCRDKIERLGSTGSFGGVYRMCRILEKVELNTLKGIDSRSRRETAEEFWNVSRYLEVNGFLEYVPHRPTEKGRRFHSKLARRFAGGSGSRALLEYPWQEMQSGAVDRLCDALLSPEFLDSKVSEGMVHSLMEDFRNALEVLSVDHPRREAISFLFEAFNRDQGFLQQKIRHFPTVVFQQIRNAIWLGDGFEPNSETYRILASVMDGWRQLAVKRDPSGVWLRSLLPPEPALGLARKKVLGLPMSRPSPVLGIQFDQTGRTVMGVAPAGIQRWDLRTSARIEDRGWDCIGGPIALAPYSERIARVAEDRTIREADQESTCAVAHPDLDATSIDALAYSPDGQLLACAYRKKRTRLAQPRDPVNIVYYQAETEDEYLHVETRTFGAINSLVFTPDRRFLISGDENGEIIVRDVYFDDVGFRLSEGSACITDLSISPDGSRLAAGDVSGDVIIWDIENRSVLQTLKKTQTTVLSVAFSPDGTLLAVSKESAVVEIWESDSGSFVRTLTNRGKKALSLAFSPDGGLLAGGIEDGTICLWTPLDGKPDSDSGERSARYDLISRTDDGKYFAAVTSGKLRYFDSRTGKNEEDQSLELPDLTIQVLSPEGKYLAGVNEKGMICVWDVLGRELKSRIRRQGYHVLQMGFGQEDEILYIEMEQESDQSWGLGQIDVVKWNLQSDKRFISGNDRSFDKYVPDIVPVYRMDGSGTANLYRMFSMENDTALVEGGSDRIRAVLPYTFDQIVKSPTARTWAALENGILHIHNMEANEEVL